MWGQPEDLHGGFEREFIISGSYRADMVEDKAQSDCNKLKNQLMLNLAQALIPLKEHWRGRTENHQHWIKTFGQIWMRQRNLFLFVFLLLFFFNFKELEMIQYNKLHLFKWYNLINLTYTHTHTHKIIITMKIINLFTICISLSSSPFAISFSTPSPCKPLFFFLDFFFRLVKYSSEKGGKSRTSSSICTWLWTINWINPLPSDQPKPLFFVTI